MPPRRNPTTEPNAWEIRSPGGNVHPEPMDILVNEATPAEKSISHHSEIFNGRGDHIKAENWLNDVEELLTTNWVYE
jgi:hypothetical protein